MNPHLRNMLISKFIIGLTSGFMLIALPLYLLELNISLAEVGYVFGIAMFFYAFLTFYFGSHSESSGRLWIGILTILGMLVASILFGILPFLALALALVVFVVSKILFNLSESILYNITKIRMLDLADHKKLGTGFGFFLLVDGIGHGVGILLGGIALSVSSFSILFFGSAVLLFFALLFFSKSGDLDIRTKKEKIWKLSNFLNTSRLFKMVLLLNTLILFGVYFTDFFALPIFQKQILGMSTKQIFIILGIAWILYGSFNKLGGKIYDKYGARIFMIGLFVSTIIHILFAFVKSVWLFSALLFVDYLSFAFSDPARFALVGSVSKAKKGMLMSFFEFFSILAAAIIILFFGKLLSVFRIEFIFILRAVTQILAIGVLFYICKLIRQRKA